MPGLRAIFFDVMDTLVRDPFHVEMPSFLGMTKAELIAKKHPTAWVDFELGRIDEATFLAIFLPEREWDAQGFRAHVHASYDWLPGVEAILAELRASSPDVTLHALSNYPPWYDVIAERCGLDRYLSSAFVSHRLGVRKPDPEAYLAPCRALGIEPRDALFVDDRATNCAAAREVGMDAIVFTGAAALRSELAARRLVG
jgi:HAD superfamily hydrolase (TIGR01509 family)